MSCHRARRALLGMTRFGEFGPDAHVHLDHLAGCHPCRDEVGCDRELVRQLRAALAARVDGMEPPATVWDQVLALAQQPEQSRFRWPWRRGAALGASRSLTAMAGTGLALVLALNTQVVTVTTSPTDAPSPLAGVPTTGVVSSWDRLPRLVDGEVAVEARTTLILVAAPDPAGVVGSVDAGAVTAAVNAPEVEEPAPPPATETFVVALPLPPEPPPAVDRHVRSAPEPEPPAPSPPEAGEPT